MEILCDGRHSMIEVRRHLLAQSIILDEMGVYVGQYGGGIMIAVADIH